jgi:hypothetical protein
VALITNGAAAFASPGSFLGGQSYRCTARNQWNRIGHELGFYAGDGSVVGLTDKSGVPYGQLHPGAWVMPIKPGAAACRNDIETSSSMTASAAAGVYVDADIETSSALTAAAQGLANAVAALATANALTVNAAAILNASVSIGTASSLAATCFGLASAVASLSTESTLDANASIGAAALVDIASACALAFTATPKANAGVALGTASALDVAAVPAVNGTVSLTTSSAIVASVQALAHAVVSITSASTVTPNGTAIASGSVELGTTIDPLSPSALAAAVWDAVAASFNSAGSMGALMNGGAAGGLTSDQAEQLLKLYQIMGLDPTKPLVVTATTRKVPADGSEIDQTIVDASGTVTVTTV